MRKSLNLLAAASLLAALGACNRQDRAAPDGERQPNRVTPEDERQLNNAVGDFHDLSNEMRNDAANVPGAVPDQASETTK
ncbi:MAG TPA: hypothetical protein VGO55_01155 [Allosphingosinicella sp.]|jgi:hypothetical protein|nr:hypothetical protein [Allosphingosinicella sp.]